MVKITVFEQLKNRLGISERTFVFLAFCSIAYLAGCLAMLIPAVRNLIIMFGEFLVRRPLTHPVWHGRFISFTVWGIILYTLFFTVFLLEGSSAGNGLIKEQLNKKTYIFALLFVLLGVFVIMFQANWTFSDDHQYITTTAVNKYVPVARYITNGRFDPLAHFYYNIPLFAFRLSGIDSGLPVEAHFALIALFYAITVMCLFFLFRSIEPVKGRIHPAFSVFFACAFFLLGSAFYGIYTCLIYPETQVVMFFAIFMFMYYRALETDKKRYYIAALMAAIYSSYCKEPVFGAFLVVAVSNLLFGYKNQSKKDKVFYAALIANGILFITMYYLFSYRNAARFYNEGRVEIQGLRFILSIFVKTPMLAIGMVFGLFRLIAIIVKKDRKHLYYDSLLFSGIAYTFAYMLLHLNGDYYFLPSIILFLPSIVYWIKYLYQTNKNRALAVFGFIMAICLYNNISDVPYIVNTWQERRTFIPYISTLLSEYNDGKEFIWYESDNTLTGNTFYRAGRDWKKYIENAFLNYMNKSEEKDFFTVSKNMDEIGSYKNVLFFYPVDNDQNQPVPDSLLNALHNNNFELFADSYGVLIYKRH
jgi:hypothetical protein